MDQNASRRRFLGTSGAIIGVTLAGCSGSSGDSGGDESPKASDYTAAEERAVDYLTTDNETGNFDGTFGDETGADEVVVKVGAEGNGGNFAYAPPAVTISTGTTVSWQWTGKGNDHNVVSTEASDFDVDSGDPKESGDPFEQSFDDTGVLLYYCEPHRTLGMKGAIVVV
ncbi:halocyanin domain-containing protein [Halosegnis sp.]|uniref:halocyanin domain-containing protein n=1 Tax=Halosegnis sp. TaxID=2864959 RepID=UPI0035D4E862